VSDAEWRELERRWRENRDDREIVARALALAEREGRRAPGGMLERRIHPPRRITSKGFVSVHAELPDGSVADLHGRLPSPRPVIQPHQGAFDRFLGAVLRRPPPAPIRGAPPELPMASPPRDVLVPEHRAFWLADLDDVETSDHTWPGLDQLFHQIEDERLPGLALVGYTLEEPGLERVSRLRHLETLKLLACSRYDDRPISLFREPSALVRLDLTGSWLKSSDLAELSGQTGLAALSLRGSPFIGDEMLTTVGALGNLSTLDLRDCPKITDAGLSRLATIAGLERLRLSGCAAIGARGVAALAPLRELRVLELRGCAIGDDAADALAGLEGLVELDVSDTPLGERGVERLLASAPRLRTLRIAGCPALTRRDALARDAASRVEVLDEPLPAAPYPAAGDIWGARAARRIVH
jgi:hypothetical protein